MDGSKGTEMCIKKILFIAFLVAALFCCTVLPIAGLIMAGNP